MGRLTPGAIYGPRGGPRQIKATRYPIELRSAKQVICRVTVLDDEDSQQPVATITLDCDVLEQVSGRFPVEAGWIDNHIRHFSDGLYRVEYEITWDDDTVQTLPLDQGPMAVMS